MPIKVGDKTFWVDVCQEGGDSTTISEDSIMLNLDMEGNGGTDINQSGTQGKPAMTPKNVKRS